LRRLIEQSRLWKLVRQEKGFSQGNDERIAGKKGPHLIPGSAWQTPALAPRTYHLVLLGLLRTRNWLAVPLSWASLSFKLAQAPCLQPIQEHEKGLSPSLPAYG